MRKTITLTLLCVATFSFAQTFTTYNSIDGLPADNTRDVAIDANNNVWVATQAGVAMFDGATFTVHNTVSHPGLVDDNTTAIAVMDNGDVWVGTDFGVSVFDGSAYTTYTETDGLSDNEINHIAQASNGDVWLGTQNGASRYDGSTFTAFGMPDIPFGGVQHVSFAANGDVWMSGGLGGVIIYDGATFSYKTTADGLISNKIKSIAMAQDGSRWIGTAEGISVLDNMDMHLADHTTPFALPAPDTLNPITDIVMSAAGMVWVGVYVDYLVTEGGVCARDGNNWRQFELADGLAGPNVRRLAVDHDDDVWVTTSTGLTEISDVHIGVEENSALPSLNIYPNPAAHTVTMLMDDAQFRNSTVEIYDAQLRLVESRNLVAGRLQMDVSAYNAGMYFVQIGTGIRKFAVMR